jgi:hypothetical protein
MPASTIDAADLNRPLHLARDKERKTDGGSLHHQSVKEMIGQEKSLDEILLSFDPLLV